MSRNGKWTAILSVTGLCLMTLLGSVSEGVAVEQHTLTCIASWQKTQDNVDFFIKDFLEPTQKEADRKFPGELKLVFKGGPEVVATNDQINAVGKGMVDMVFGSTSYYVSKLPETDILNISPMNPWEEKATGLYTYLDKLHNEKTNTHFLMRNGLGLPFKFVLIKPIKRLDDLKGMNIRGNPTTVQMLKAMGANPVQMSVGDMYTALERGVIQGAVFPTVILPDLGLQKVVKYVVDPGFYSSINNIVINLDKWNKLPKHLQNLLTEQAEQHARRMVAHNQALDKEVTAQLKSAGIIYLELPKEDARRMLQIANDAMINTVLEKAPVEGKKILEYLKIKAK